MDETKYLVPESLKEALSLVGELGGRACLIAGGTDVVVKLKKGVDVAETLIDLSKLTELDYIRVTRDGLLELGAGVSLWEVERSSLILDKWKVLSLAAGQMASPTVRRMATAGGNICNAAPSADFVPALMVLGAYLTLSSLDRERTVPVEKFFLGPGRTALEKGEMLTAITVPAPAPHSGSVYLKQKRREGADLAVSGVAAAVQVAGTPLGPGEAPQIREVKLALAAVAPVPLRARAAEDALRGAAASTELLARAGEIAAGECSPLDDVRASAWYRRKLIATLTSRALGQAVEEALLERLS